MYQTKKGNQRYFGMKAHIGVDTDSGLVQWWLVGDQAREVVAKIDLEALVGLLLQQNGSGCHGAALGEFG